MNFIDIVFIVIFGIAGIMGFRKGLIIGLATLAALIVGVWAGYYFSDLVSGWIANLFDYNGPYINIISFLIIFVAVIILVFMLAKIVERAVDLAALSPVNKLAGLAFGVLRAALLLSVLIYFLNRFDPQRKFITPETRQSSLLFPLVEGIAPVLIPKMKAYTEQLPDLDKPAVSPSDSIPAGE